MRIKTKLQLGTGFLFAVIIIFGVLSLVTIDRLKTDATLILKNNFESLVYSNNMFQALDTIGKKQGALNAFAENLHKQQSNITEPGEQNVTSRLGHNFELLKKNPVDDSLKSLIRHDLGQINLLNQAAILRKNQAAAVTASRANDWLILIFSILTLITFSLSLNFPAVLSRPITKLTEGIRSIVNKDYSKRIYLDQKDEFGEMAGAFNIMAEKLDEFEHSNLAQIKFEKSRIETIINQMKDGIIGLDEKKNILFINVVAQQLMGVKEKDLSGTYAPDLAVTNDLMRYVLHDENRTKEMKIYADNKESYFHLEILNVNNNQQVIGQVIILRNITAFHELDEAKTNFIATISHELKTPIAAIKISTQLLGDERIGVINPEQEGLVKSINDDANRLLKITTELLNISQLETGKIELLMERVACRDIIAEAVQSVEYILKQKSITIRQEVIEEISDVLADKEKTSWVLINFLTNAIKHSLPATEIELINKRAGNKIQFMVKDFGKGMEPKYLSRIFDRYYKIPGEHSGTGTGLGLTIAKEFIEAQGGHIWVESMLGVGSTFGFELPIAAENRGLS